MLPLREEDENDFITIEEGIADMLQCCFPEKRTIGIYCH